MLQRIRRSISLLIAGGLLLIWLGIGALWIRSYWRGDCFAYAWGTESTPNAAGFAPSQFEHEILFMSSRGGVCFSFRRGYQVVMPPFLVNSGRWEVFNNPTYPNPSMWAVATRAPVGPQWSWQLMRNVVQSTAPVQPARNYQISGTGTITVFPVPGPQSTPPTPTTTAAFPGILPQPPAPVGAASLFMFYRVGLGPNHYLRMGDTTYVAIFPWWVAFGMLTFLITPALFLILRHRRNQRRRREGCCMVCGYDLRATPDRCPECGMIPLTSHSKHFATDGAPTSTD